jgi:hypothetical protein
MVRLVMMLLAALVMSTADGTAHASSPIQAFPVQAVPRRTTFILRRMVRFGSRRNPRASWAGSIP